MESFRAEVVIDPNVNYVDDDGRPFDLAKIASRKYLRTGDKGFIYRGELFICGRLKDVIIINGLTCQHY
jgi:acyl-CoA synthetase (AMP-forming)/AMP-acid ligase II